MRGYGRHGRPRENLTGARAQRDFLKHSSGEIETSGIPNIAPKHWQIRMTKSTETVLS